MDKRFECILHEQPSGEAFRGDWLYILKDTKTGVLYLAFCSGWGGGLTVMLDKDGKPLTK